MKNKKTVVYETIKKRIINGELTPGLAINENEFAKHLEVSKTPVREALRQLEREGLIENIPGRGSAVTHISLQDVREIFELREILECGAVKRVAVIRDVKKIQAKKKELEQLISENIEAKYSGMGPEEEVHQFVIQYLNNRKLNEAYSDLLNQITRIRNHFRGPVSSKRYDEKFYEHIEIFDALIEGDAERAEKAVKTHLRNFAAEFLGFT